MLRRAPAGFDLERLFAGLDGHNGVALAVSGGADSLALMVLVERWRRATGARTIIHVYCVDHGLRPESGLEAAMVVGVAGTLGFLPRVLVWEGAKPTRGVQAAARAARYTLMGRAMEADGADLLLTGHHADDQAETILMRAAHGSGPKGLAGMAARAIVEGVPVFRPLLGVQADRLGEVVREAGLPVATDPGNTSQNYERVRWRKILGPLAKNGLTASRINRFGRRMGEAEVALAEFANRQFGELGCMDNWGVVHLPEDAVGDLPRDTAVRVVRMAVAAATGRAPGFAIAPFEELVNRMLDARFRGATIGGAAIVRRGQSFLVFREASRIAATAISVRAGQTVIWDARFEISANKDQPLLVRPSDDLTRQRTALLFGKKTGLEIDVPMAAVRAAPCVRVPGGEVVGVGAHILDQRVNVVLVGPTGTKDPLFTSQTGRKI